MARWSTTSSAHSGMIPGQPSGPDCPGMHACTRGVRVPAASATRAYGLSRCRRGAARLAAAACRRAGGRGGGYMDSGAARGPAWRDSGLADEDLLAVVRSRPPGDPERQAACERLIIRYESIVRSCVYRYRGSPESAEDLMQVG